MNANGHEKLVKPDALFDLSNQEIDLLPTSCWSKNHHESYLMWKSYAGEVGVCIESSVSNVVASLENDYSDDPNTGNHIICGSMDYVGVGDSEANKLFGKSNAFKDEEEFRFYFHHEDDNSEMDHLFIPINPTILIDKIFLSPFVCPKACEKIVSMLKSDYNLPIVVPSKIKFQ